MKRSTDERWAHLEKIQQAVNELHSPYARLKSNFINSPYHDTRHFTLDTLDSQLMAQVKVAL